MNAKEIIKFVREVKSAIENARPRAKSDFELICVEFNEPDEFEELPEFDEDDVEERESTPKQDAWRVVFIHECGVTESLEIPAKDLSSSDLVDCVIRCAKIFD